SPQVLQPVARLDRQGNRAPVDDDRSAFAAVFGEQNAHVLLVMPQRLRLHDLQVVVVDEQRAEQDETRDGETTERRVHGLITCVVSSADAVVSRPGGACVGRRAASLIRSSNAMSIQLATSDEPPYDTNGNVNPVSGI